MLEALDTRIEEIDKATEARSVQTQQELDTRMDKMEKYLQVKETRTQEEIWAESERRLKEIEEDRALRAQKLAGFEAEENIRREHEAAMRVSVEVRQAQKEADELEAKRENRFPPQTPEQLHDLVYNRIEISKNVIAAFERLSMIKMSRPSAADISEPTFAMYKFSVEEIEQILRLFAIDFLGNPSLFPKLPPSLWQHLPPELIPEIYSMTELPRFIKQDPSHSHAFGDRSTQMIHDQSLYDYWHGMDRKEIWRNYSLDGFKRTTGRDLIWGWIIQKEKDYVPLFTGTSRECGEWANKNHPGSWTLRHARVNGTYL